MNYKNLPLLGFICLALGTQTMNAQNSTVFEQLSELEGTMIAGSSALSRKVHIADDFILSKDTKISTITLVGSQIIQNLPSILLSTDFLIIEAETLTNDPVSENVIYQSLGNMDGIKLKSSGYSQDFIIDLENKNIQLKANKKYWFVFSSYVNAPTPSNMTDWHNYPGYNSSGTSLAKRYTNGTWSALDTGLSFKIEGINSLGTVELFENKAALLASTLVQHTLEVRTPNYLSLAVYDFSGKLILTSEKVINNVSFLNSGNYLAVITLKNGQRQTVKFIKK